MNRRDFMSTLGVAGYLEKQSFAREEHSGDWKLSRETYRGLYAYPPTPFADDYSLDEEALRQNLRKLVRIGVDGIVLAGSTGEFYTLTDQDYRRIAEILREETRGKNVASVLGTASLNTREAIDRARMAMDVGLDAVLAMQPFYTRLTNRELLNFWSELCRACPNISFIVYHFEWVRQSYTAEIYRQLAQFPNMLGSKEAHWNFQEWLALQQDRSLVHMSATDTGWLVELYRRGAPGVGSVNISLLPNVIHRVLKLCGEGRYLEAERAYLRFTDFMGEMQSGSGKPFLFPSELGNWGEYSGTARHKALTDAIGFLKAGPPRPPGLRVPEDLQKRVKDYLARRYQDLLPPANFAESIPPGTKLWPRSSRPGDRRG